MLCEKWGIFLLECIYCVDNLDNIIIETSKYVFSPGESLLSQI